MTTKFLSLLTTTVLLGVSLSSQAQYGPGRGGGRRPQPPPQHHRYDSKCVVHGTKSNGHGYPSTSAEYEAVGRNDREACNLALNYCYQDRARNCQVTEVNGYPVYNPGYPGHGGGYDPYNPGHGGGGGYTPYPEDGAPGVGGGIGQCQTIVYPDGREETRCL